MNAPDLHTHSGYSIYDGLGSPQSVVDRAVALGWGAVALTEHGHMLSAPALYKAAKEAKIKPILGCEMYVTPDDDLIDGDKTVLKARRHLTVLALSFEGYQNLVAWQNVSMQRPLYYNGPRISIDKMLETAPHGLDHNVVLSGCLGGELCQCLMHGNGDAEMTATMYLDSARQAFPNFYVELMNHSLDKFQGIGLENYDALIKDEEKARAQLLDLAKTLGIPVIVTNDSHYQSSDQRKPHIAMMARKLAHGTSESFTSQYGYWTNYLRSMESIAETLPVWARREAIDSIERIVDAVDIKIDPLDKFSYTLPRSGYDDPVEEIRRRSKPRLKNMIQRYGDKAAERFDYELSAMGGFAHYLLIYSDIIRMARASGIYTWTRGSAANSLVNYCLRIHEIDPIKYRLIFERFVNPARAKFPDVDIDIEGHRQGDVARMITEHMEAIEGKGNVMPICTYGTLNNRAAFRMMAEAAGVEQDKIDELAKLLPQMIDSGMVQSDEEAYEMLFEELGIDLHANAAAIFDQVGSVSQHACAFALGTRDRPIPDWVPAYRIGSSDAVVTQFNMKWIEELGFLKLDLLKLDSLSIMHSVARMLGHDINWLDKVAMPEPGIYELDDESLAMLRAGSTEGIHSFQGGSQRRGAIEVGVESVDDMVAVQALYRPSGTRTGNDKHYVDRKHGREDWSSTNEFVAGYLDESYGFAIYQEQIMEMAFGMGMSGEEVDDLYKAIKTAKGVGRGAKELFDKFEPTYRKYADKLWSKAEADEIWAQWDQLQGYTFNRGHATSYAIIAAKMAWLKCHYPQEFFVALLDRYPKNPRYLAAAIAEGFHFEPPDVNTSAKGFTRGRDTNAIQVGLLRIAGIGDGAANAIARNQPFASVEDLIERVGSRFIKQGDKVNTVEILGAAGALDSLGIAADDDDLAQFRLLDFVLQKPKAFKGKKPQLPKRSGGKWEFLGLSADAKPTWGKKFCAKLFWIPEGADFVTKTSATGKYNAHLLTVIDINGLPFDLVVAEDKEHESRLVKYLHKKCQDAVVCAEGQIAMPFLRGGNTAFRLWGISGAEDDNPQCWGITENDAKAISMIAKDKRAARSR